MNEKLIEEAKLYIQEIFKNNSDGHDANHSLRVYKNALQIAKEYPECNMMAVALSSLLHDVDDHKLFATKDNMNADNSLKIIILIMMTSSLSARLSMACLLARTKKDNPKPLKEKSFRTQTE